MFASGKFIQTFRNRIVYGIERFKKIIRLAFEGAQNM